MREITTMYVSAHWNANAACMIPAYWLAQYDEHDGTLLGGRGDTEAEAIAALRRDFGN